MNAAAAEALRSRLEADGDADMASLATGTDKKLAIGRDVWRLRWRGETTTAVAADADLSTTCGALLDALALAEDRHRLPGPGGADTAFEVVNVLVDRPLPAEGSETDQALRTVRDAVMGIIARVWYRRPGGGWVQDTAPPPSWRNDPRPADWVQRLLLARLRAQPTGLVVALIDAVDDPSLHLY